MKINYEKKYYFFYGITFFALYIISVAWTVCIDKAEKNLTNQYNASILSIWLIKSITALFGMRIKIT